MLARLISLIIFLCTFVAAESLEVNSPNGVLKVTFTLDDGEPRYAVTRFDREVVRTSRMGFVLRDANPLSRDFQILESELRNVDDIWNTILGERKVVRDNFIELTVQLQEKSGDKRRMNVIFRAFNDGIGFRYEIPKQRKLKKMNIIDELTEFALAGDHESWWVGAYLRNRYEYL